MEKKKKNRTQSDAKQWAEESRLEAIASKLRKMLTLNIKGVVRYVYTLA